MKKIENIPVNIYQFGDLVPIGRGHIENDKLIIEIENEDVVGRFTDLAEIGQVTGVTVGLTFRTRSHDER